MKHKSGNVNLKLLTVSILTFFFFPFAVYALPGDLDGSGRVDGYDLIIFGRANGSIPGDLNWNPDADLNGDGKVDSTDLAILSTHFGNTGISFGVWVGDQTSGSLRVSKLSSGGNVLRRVGNFNNPISLSCNLKDGTVWVADSGEDKIKKIASFDGATLLTVSGMDPYSVSVNSKDGTVWVADYNNNRVIKLLPTITDGYTIGTNTGSHIAVVGFNRPRSVSVNPETGVVWVADMNNNRIVRLSPDVPDGYNASTGSGKHVVKTGFSSPYSVSVNASDGTVWVADYGNNQVAKLSSAGTTELYRIPGFSQPYAVDVNYVDGSVWIADTGKDRVVRLAHDGAVLVTAGGVNDPIAVAVNPLDGTCWVADYLNNQVVKLAPNGAELLRIGGFYRPMALAVTPDEISALKSPVATASLSSNNVDVGEVVTFTGTGTDPDGTIVLYEWDFNGDGRFEYRSATTGVTTYAYGSTGVYNPVFRVTDNDRLTATDFSQIIRVGRLTAIAGSDKTSGNAPLTVNFTASFIDPINGFVDNYQWDFDGDNIFDYYSESTGNTSYTYSKAGTYRATLKVVDGPHTATASLTITVLPSSPTATASGLPSIGMPPLTVNFTGTGTDPDGTILLYAWDFNGDGVFDWYSTSSGNATQTYASSGTYKAKFRVLDNDGLSAIREVTINVGEALPVAVANATPRRGYPPLPVNFNATGSHDPNGSLVLYEWNFGCTNTVFFSDNMEEGTANWTADTPWGQTTSTSKSPTKSWTDSPSGNYSNSANTSLTSRTIDLSGSSSGILKFWHRYDLESGYDYGRVEISTNAGATWTQLATYTGTLASWTEVQLDISSYLPSPNVKIRFRLTSDSSYNSDGWYIDDVSISACLFNWTTYPGGTASHTFTLEGNYTSTLRVTDNDGNKATASVSINVLPLRMPMATAGANPTTGTASLPVTFTGTGVDPQKNDGTPGGIANYHWNFGEEYVWVADTGNDKVVRLYQDGSGEIVRKSDFNDPYSVSVNPSDGTVWIADYYNNQVVRLSADGRTELARVGGFYYPTSVSVNPIDGTVWVADYYNNQVVKLNADGSGELVRKGGFNRPFAVSVNLADGSVWGADSNNNQVVKLGADGTELIRVSGFNYPISVSVNITEGSVWVADYNNNRIVKLLSSVPNGYNIGTNTGSHVILTGFNRPYSVSVNSADGTCWVADYYNHKIVKVKADGSEKLVNVGGFNSPLSVSVNSTTGIVWVADHYNHQIVKLDPNGTELARLSGFNYPRAVGVADTGVSNYYSSATTGNTTHNYSVPGIYRAIFTVTDGDGNRDTGSVLIRVYGIPIVAAGANVTSGRAPLEVFLYGTASDLDGTIAKYEWDFNGDGIYDWSSTNTASVRYVYSTAGTFQARLRVTDMDGYSNTSAVTIAVDGAPPTVRAGAAPIKGNASLLVNFFGTASDPDGTITLYEWDFDGNGTYDWSSSSSPNTTYTYNTPKSNPGYLAELRVTDNNGLKTTSTVEINVYAPGTPSALMYAEPTQGVNPLTVRFCGHGIDPDGTISSYEWDFGTGGGWTAPSASPPTVFGDKMEDGTGYWTAGAPWARIYTDYYSPSYSWTDSPGGDYANNANTSLESKTINLTGTVAPRLIFWHKYDFNSGDYGRVEVSGNNGSTWTELGNFTNGTLAAWTRQEYSLFAYKGNATVKIRFRVTSDASGTGDGWYIDDVWVGDCVTYTYPNQGQFTASLKVTDNAAKWAIATEKITVFANQNTSFVWVADYSNQQVVKLSDDGNVLARISGFNYPREVKVNPTNGDVWVADTNINRVVKLSSPDQNGYDVTKNNTPDSSPNKNGGALFGNAVLGAGKLGASGLVLDGSGDYVQVPDSPVFRMNSWTMEAWINPSNVAGIRTIVGKVNQGKDFALVLNDNKPAVLVYQGGRRYVTSPDALTTGTWYHIAGVYDAVTGNVMLYVDGVLKKQEAWTSDTSNTDPLLIGRSNCCPGEAFLGTIDDVRTWNVTRSGPDIASARNSELTGSESGLVGYWKLNDSKTYSFSTGFNQPFYIAVDHTDHSAWVTDRNNNKVVKLASNGTETLRLSGFSYPRRVAVYQADRSVWVTDESNNQVVKLSSTGTELLRIGGFYTPVGIVVDQADGSVWVADYNNSQVVKLSATGTVLYRISGFNRPVTVAVNPNDRSIWVTDHYNHQVVKLSSTGSEIARISGFYYPHDLDVNTKDGTVWVSDHYNQQIVKLAPDGTELLRIDGFNRPIGVSVDEATRNLPSPPIASSTATWTSGNAPLTVTFTGSGTGTGTIVRYQWDFDGNGTFDYDSPTTGNTIYTYTAPGTYNPIFRVMNNAGLMDYDGPHTIYVGPLTVYATASPSTGNPPLNATLDGYVRGLGLGRSIVKYEWDFEGDGIFDWNNASSPKTTKNYTRGGTYAAVLRVTDNLGNQAYDSVAIVVNMVGPTANNNATPTSGPVPLTVTLNGSGSDADGSIVLYEWDYDGDGVYDWFSFSTGNTFFTYTTVGTYTATLRVTDNDGFTATASKTITVTNRQDPPSATASADVMEGPAPLTVNFTGSGNDPDDGQIVLYEWDFDGDGTYDWSSTTTGNTSYTYTLPGQYNATLRVKDFDNLTATASVLISVKVAGTPRAVANATPRLGEPPMVVNFSALGSYDPNGTIALYEWTFGEEIVWVADYSNNKVVRLEGYQEDKRLSGFNRPYRVSINQTDGTVWVTDHENDKVVKLKADGNGELARVSGFDNPWGISVNQADGTVWVSSWHQNQVVKLAANGAELVRKGGFYHPAGVAVDSARNVVWVADYDNSQVVRLNASDGTELARITGFNRPIWISVNPNDGSAWVADRYNNRVVKLFGNPPNGYSASGASGTYHKAQSGFNEALCTAVNPLDGTVWACDYVNNRMVKISPDCSREILRVGGFNRPHEAFVNPQDGTVWVADHSNNQIVKLSSDGREIKRIGGFNGPTSIGAYNPPSNRFSSTTSGNTTHTYTKVGEYIATLKVTDNVGLFDTDSVSIQVGLPPESLPKAYPTSGTAPLTVRFFSDGRSPYSTITAYYWDFNGDGTIDNPDFWSYSVPLTYSYTYQRPGTYYASQRVVDGRGLSDTKTIAITVTPPDPKPTAKAMADPVEGNAPLLVNFNGLGMDSDGFVKKYEWDFTNDGVYDFISNTTGKTTYTYASPGIYNAKLKVTDNDNNTATDTVRIEVKPSGSPLAIASATPTSGFATLKVTFTGSGTDNGTIVKYEWDFDGNGVYDWSSTTSGNTFYNYTTAGSYNATLRVTDNDGLTDTAVVKISVAPGLKASLSADIFDPTDGQIVYINTVLTGDAAITIKIKDTVGNVIRTLINNVLRSAGYYSDEWDGRNSSGQIVEAGVYYYVVEYTVGGTTYVYDVTNDVSIDRYAPSVTYPPTFNPFSSATNFFRYTLPQKSEVTVYMSHWNWGGYGGAGPRVKTLLNRKPQKTGSYVMVWDGTDDGGNLVETGEYLITVWGWRLPDNAIIVSKEPIISDLLVIPNYFNPDSLPYDEQYRATFTYTLSKTSNVTATIYDSRNFLVRTVTMNGVPAGSRNVLLWDGKNSNGAMVTPGTYRAKLVATDSLGNRSLDANSLVGVFY